MIEVLKNIKNLLTEKKYPLLNVNEYLALFNEIKDEVSKEIDFIEKDYGYKIEKKWIDELALHTQIVKKKSKLNYHHGRLLYSVLRKYMENNPKIKIFNIIETGTARGFSSLCMSKALEDSEKVGRIFTIDIIPHNKKLYWNCIDDCEGKKTRNELLEKWRYYLDNIVFITGRSQEILDSFYLKRINFAFLDAQHNYENIKNEFNFVSDKQLKGDVIIFDDVNVKEFPEIDRFINELKIKKIYDCKIINSSNKRSYCYAKKF